MENNIQKWYESINEIFAFRGVPERYRWKEEKDVIRVLNAVGKKDISVAFFPQGDKANFLGMSSLEGIELVLEKDAKKVTEKIEPVEKRVHNYLLPGCLHLGSFKDDNGAFTYLRLETNKGPYAFFAKGSPAINHLIKPMNYAVNESIDEFREFIGSLRLNY